MRIAVFSDIHGNGAAVEKIIEKNKGVKHFIFLGDGIREVEKAAENHPDKEFHIVAGNCDFSADYPKTDYFEIAGHKIMYTHGHTHYVKYGLERILLSAQCSGADIICFGHTHERVNEYFGGIYILNPSSASCPRDGKKPAYAFIDIENNGVFVSHVDL